MLTIFRQILALARCNRIFRDEQMKPLGLKGVHARYLTEIGDHPGISQDGLSRYILSDKSSIARQVATLEQEGLITRTPAPGDKRCLQLHLTEKAHTILPRLLLAQEQWEQHMAGDLTPEEKQTLSELLSKILNRARGGGLD